MEHGNWTLQAEPGEIYAKCKADGGGGAAGGAWETTWPCSQRQSSCDGHGPERPATMCADKCAGH